MIVSDRIFENFFGIRKTLIFPGSKLNAAEGVPKERSETVRERPACEYCRVMQFGSCVALLQQVHATHCNTHLQLFLFTDEERDAKIS